MYWRIQFPRATAYGRPDDQGGHALKWLEAKSVMRGGQIAISGSQPRGQIFIFISNHI